MSDVARRKVLLDESEMPTRWYNLIPDLPSPPPPPLHPGTLQPVGPADLAPLFPDELIGQEVTGERYVEIPGEVLDVYRMWRPSPLYRASRLEKALGTPARIYYKYEGVSPILANCSSASSPMIVWCISTWLSTLPSEYRAVGSAAATSTASLIAMPSEPG